SLLQRNQLSLLPKMRGGKQLVPSPDECAVAVLVDNHGTTSSNSQPPNVQNDAWGPSKMSH
ncbi:hypothetical protein QN391_17840, partial [Pseudomonas sp. CCI1.2]|uniref:hypothetical protein n=1 Tax=Pseudomonas sp. CCI1.2 TaxID=3048614 RepID=UPI002B239779